MSKQAATKIRAGLYRVGHHTIEEIHNGSAWVWRVTNDDNFFDGWVGDYTTKREAMEAIA